MVRFTDPLVRAGGLHSSWSCRFSLSRDGTRVRREGPGAAKLERLSWYVTVYYMVKLRVNCGGVDVFGVWQLMHCINNSYNFAPSIRWCKINS